VLAGSECERERSPYAAIDALVGTVGSLMRASSVARERVVGVGMGLPGPVDRDTGGVGPPERPRDIVTGGERSAAGEPLLAAIRETASPSPIHTSLEEVRCPEVR
jgi:hypothetical protein